MNITMNFTAFTSMTMAAKVLAAMQEVKATGNVVRIKNRRNVEFLLCTIHKDSIGYTYRFITAEGQDVTGLIQRASNHWVYSHQQAVWALFSWANDLKEHPVVTLERKARWVERVKDHGATHKIILLGGSILYGGYQRDLLGRKRLYALSDGAERLFGRPVKLTREAFLTVSHVEVLA